MLKLSYVTHALKRQTFFKHQMTVKISIAELKVLVFTGFLYRQNISTRSYHSTLCGVSENQELKGTSSIFWLENSS